MKKFCQKRIIEGIFLIIAGYSVAFIFRLLDMCLGGGHIPLKDGYVFLMGVAIIGILELIIFSFLWVISKITEFFKR